MPRGHFGGLERALLWRVDPTTGGCLGVQGTLANGSASGAYVASKARSATFNYEGVATLQQQGGDKLGNLISFANAKLAPFDLTIDESDTDLDTLVEESTPNTTNSEFTKVASNPSKPHPVILGGCFQRPGNLVSGAQAYENVFIPRFWASLRRGGGTFRGEALKTINVVPIIGKRAHTGQTFGSGATGLNYGLVDDETDSYAWYSDYPLHLMGFRQDGIATTFTASYKPLSSVITLNSTPNEFVIGGTPTALSSFSLTTALATLAAVGSAGVLDILSYETGFVAP